MKFPSLIELFLVDKKIDALDKIETNNQNVVKNIVNVYAKGTIVITKYDSTGALLSNVKFQILNEAGDVVDTITTNEQGVATSKKLLLGKYFYREISAPDHVVMDTEKHEFSLTENNEIVKKDVINKVKEGKLKIIKVDENNKPLEGVTFNIYDEDNKIHCSHCACYLLFAILLMQQSVQHYKTGP